MDLRSGIDLVSVERIARLQAELGQERLARLFGSEELSHCQSLRFPERHLAERFAAKEACLKLFPCETTAGELTVEDIEVSNGTGRLLHLNPGERLRRIMEKHGVEEIAISTSSSRKEACAIAVTTRRTGEADGAGEGSSANEAGEGAPLERELVDPGLLNPGLLNPGLLNPGAIPPALIDAAELQAAVERVRQLRPSLAGRLIHALCPIRRSVVRRNMRQVFGDALSPQEHRRLAQVFYANMGRFLLETAAYTFLPPRHLAGRVRVENMESPLGAAAQGRGLIILTGHFGSWESSCLGGIQRFQQYRGKFHFLRRPISIGFIDRLVVRRFRRAGLGVIPKKQSLFSVLEVLERGEALVFILDQHASVPRDGVPVEFFGKKAGTFRSLAQLARASGAPVVPAHGYRDRDGSHVMRFEEPLEWIRHDDPAREIYLNTLAYNRALERMILRHPEQWFWMHRRWKLREKR